MNNKKTIIILISIILFGILVAGSTFAWWTWISSNEQNTSVTFTVANGNNQLKAVLDANTTIINDLAPTANCAGTFAKKVDVTTYYQNETPATALINATLTLTSVTSSNTAGINRSKINYAITTESGSSCANLNNIIASGNLGNKANGDTIYTGDLAIGTIPSGTSLSSSTIYLYFWIDASYVHNNSGNSVVNDPMQNMTIKVEWSGTITNEMSSLPTYVYTAQSTHLLVGNTISSNIILYSTPQAAMHAVKSMGDGSETPYCVKHKIENGVVTENYVVYAINDAKHEADSMMTPGIYELKGGDGGAAYTDNVATLLASASGRCKDATDRPGANGTACFSNGYYIAAYDNGYVNVNLNNNTNCLVWTDSDARCKND